MRRDVDTNVAARPPTAMNGEGDVASESFAGALHEGLGRNGQPLAPDTRRRLEPRFAADLSHVRVHADDAASRLAQSIGARAFTLNHHIFFDQGEFTPHTGGGQRLLAHELAHVFQQDSGGPPVVQRAPSPGAQGPKPKKIYSDPRVSASARKVALALLFENTENRRLERVNAETLATNLMERPKPGEVLVAVFDVLAGYTPELGHMVARTVAGKLTRAELDKLLVDIWGPIAVERLRSLAPLSAEVADMLRDHGRIDLMGKAQQHIVGNKSTTNTDTQCIDCVKHNFAGLFGEDVAKNTGTEAYDLYKQEKDEEDERLKRGERLQKGEEPVRFGLRHYARVRELAGRAREIGACEFDHSECLKSIKFDLKLAKKQNPGQEQPEPWAFINAEGAPVYKPDPMALIEHAIKHGADGLYPFAAGVAGHHAVTIIARKEGGAVTLHWNDPGAIQFNIKFEKIAAKNNWPFTPEIGRPVDRKKLALKIWANAFSESKDPAQVYAKWRNDQGAEAAKYSPTFDPKDPDHVRIVKSLRCFTRGIRLWQLFPTEK